MIKEIIIQHLSTHDGLLASEVARDVLMSIHSCRKILQEMKKKGEVTTNGYRPARFFAEKKNFPSRIMDEYILRVLSREPHKMLTIREVEKITNLTVYKIELSLRRLKNLEKIKTIPAHGIQVLNPSKEKTKEIVYWKTTEINFIKNNYLTMSTAEMAEKLGRTDRSVLTKVMKLNISLVKRRCSHGHEMKQRPSGRWVCNDCHAERERERRDKIYTKVRTVGYPNVYKDTLHNTFRGCVLFNRNKYHLGSFVRPERADVAVRLFKYWLKQGYRDVPTGKDMTYVYFDPDR